METIRVFIAGDVQRSRAVLEVEKAPIGCEVVIRDVPNKRSNDQNARMWADAIHDIAEQAYLEGRRYSADVWHEYFKREFLPEQYIEGKTKEGYYKWEYLPSGDRILKGSTTHLTKAGFSEYLEKIYAFGANLGVVFGADYAEY